MDLLKFFYLIFVTGGSTTFGSFPVFFHRYLKDSQWNYLESFGGGVMTGASLFSLYYPAWLLLQERNQGFTPMIWGVVLGFIFIFFSARGIERLTKNSLHQRAILFVFVMGLHNVPEGLAVGVDVAGLGVRESLPLAIAIFIQNLPEGFVSAMMFLVAGFSLRNALLANFATAVIEAVSSLFGYYFVLHSSLDLPFMLSFAGTSMLTVVLREAHFKIRGTEAANFSPWGFALGILICAVLDFIL